MYTCACIYVYVCVCVSFKWQNTESKDPRFFKVKTAHQEPGSANQATNRQGFFLALKQTSAPGTQLPTRARRNKAGSSV